MVFQGEWFYAQPKEKSDAGSITLLAKPRQALGLLLSIDLSSITSKSNFMIPSAFSSCQCSTRAVRVHNLSGWPAQYVRNTCSISAVEPHSLGGICRKMLIDKNMNKQDLKELSGVSAASIAKLGKGENITTDVLLKICEAMDCNISDIMESVKE